MRVAIIMPTGDMVHADTAMCLAYALSQQWGDRFAIINPRSSTIAKGRWQGVKQALQINPDRILFIDSDMVFTPGDVMKLLQHDLDFVSGLCTTRREPIEHVARHLNGEKVDFTGKTGLVKVGTTGLAFAAIKSEVFRKLPEPWFNTSFGEVRIHGNLGWVSEDEDFCYNAWSEGYQIMIDTDIKIGHIGQKVYGL